MSLPLITVWAERDSPRLRYVLDWLMRERLGLRYRLTTDREEAASAAHCISYGRPEHGLSLHDAGLLWQSGVGAQNPASGEWEGLCALFYLPESPCDIRFDMLSGIFYLLTRYEEYLPFSPDRHGRYPAEGSILHQLGVLERPAVDEWVEALRLFLQEAWGIDIPPGKFRFRASYDIDIAWSFRYKGLARNIGAGLGDLLRDRRRFLQRLHVLGGREDDPYNAYVWLGSMHLQYGLDPIWFFLAALQPSRFDKNIPPRHPQMSALIRGFSESMDTGMHPSYFADSVPGRLAEEKSIMEDITGKPVTISRQHYIRLRFPGTYHALIAAGITDDYSMGYSTHFGFRAGTGSSFLWYDLSTEAVTGLRVHPFVFMDTTGRFDLGLSPEESFQRLDGIAEKLIAAHGTLITVMHNFSLGSDGGWAGWREAYGGFVARISRFREGS